MRPAWLENWLIRNTPSCRDVVRRLSDEMERPLPFHTRIAVRLHFLICTWCVRYHEQIRLIRTMLRSTESGSPTGDPADHSGARLTDKARERLKQLTRQEHS